MNEPWKPLFFFENEDEETLKEEFVRFTVRYPGHTPYQIAQHLFKDLKEPELRAGQASNLWSIDLDIQERIRKYKLFGIPQDLPTREEHLAFLARKLADNSVPEKEKTVYSKQFADIQGWVVKENTTNLNMPNGLPTFVIGRYDD